MDGQQDDSQERRVAPRQGVLPGAFRLGYPMPRGRWDEMVDAEGALRPQWERFVGFLGGMPTEEMKRRWTLSLRLISENGVTYNVYGDPRGLDRPWPLDPLPMILTTQEWRSIEAALVQRATLLNGILADLYGPRRLLSSELLPPEVVLAHPGYLRPVHGVKPPGGTYLHLYAADLARSPDGQWWVVNDRCEAPSGAGYALENRAIIGRLMADMLRRQPVKPLTPFFEKFQETLAGLTPAGRDDGRIVLMTPGPYNETYFEHAYLARHLGYTLVEGEDLTVRDGRVWLKTLDGLQPVSVILRRTTAAYCDPLELRSESLLGVAGLAQAIRAGNVVVANSLGSGVIEGGALAPFLPGLARHLLGEELKMPSVATWWCGQQQPRDYVYANLERLVVKPAFAATDAMTPLFGHDLSAADRAKLFEAIRRRPDHFIAQERVHLSTAPVLTGDSLDPRPLMLRVYLAAHGGGYVAMPGGLTRVASERGGSLVSIQEGGGSKDTWILAERSERAQAATVRTAPPVRLVRGARDLPSRVADNLYWFGRYLERSEDTARLLRAAFSRVGSYVRLGSADELPLTLAMLRRNFKTKAGLSDDAQVQEVAVMAFGAEHPDGVRAIVERVHRRAWLARDRLSPDTWRAVNRLLQAVTAVEPDPPPNLEDALNGLNDLVLAAEAMSGLVMENMTRGLAWRFVDLGRRLERSLQVLDQVSGILPHPGRTGGPALEVLLEVFDSTMTYRSRYLSAPQFAPVVDLLIADEANPRSLAFQLQAIEEHMNQLAASRRSPFLGAEQRLAVWLTGAVRTAEIEIVCLPDEDGESRNLAHFLEVLRSKLWELSETVTRQYFTHAVTGGRAVSVRRADTWL
ncbi:MAG TPA: circularly permuted type 2 ATP-grasp protein [Rhodospirillaceae bacterium]|nr:circularly permuted type 2 ATP-grasp protein [Rhodospirillaceae bacterium]